jgi:hypothetical protein
MGSGQPKPGHLPGSCCLGLLSHSGEATQPPDIPLAGGGGGGEMLKDVDVILQIALAIFFS